tara:strand:+ start:29462 stop:30310 length:849 start_codon:yes stop_codon:yes gene_type:complete
MDKIIGLGQAGCNIAKAFETYPQYECYYFDTEPHESQRSVLVSKQDNHERYEEACPSYENELSDLTGDVLFVLGGGGTISGMCLRLLEQVAKRAKNTSLLYIKPDTSLLGETKKLQERATYMVLQEYTRSGAFKQMIIVDNSELENILGELPIIGYHDKLNEMVVSTLHMMNIFENTKSVDDTFAALPKTARIVTIGVMNIEDNKENLFFSLENLKEIRYYYAINENELNKSSGLFRNIKENVKSKTSDEVSACYGIYSTNYDQNYGYLAHYSSHIQDDKKS